MDAADTLVTTLTLRELNDPRYRDKLDSGDFWGVIKLLSQLRDVPDVQCYENLLEEYRQTNEKFIFAVCCLNIFIQNNFTGPLVSFRSSVEDFDENWVRNNSEPNSQVYPLTRCLKFLELAAQHFSSPNASFTNKLFHLRCLYLKEVIFEVVRPSSYDGFAELVSDLERQLDDFPFSAQLRSTLLVEFGFMYMFYSQLTESNRCIQNAEELVSFELELTGAMGRRTRSQRNEIAFLRVKTYFRQRPEFDDLPQETEPENINIDDYDLLESVSYNERYVNTITNFTAPFLLYAACSSLKNSCLDNMLREEVLTYLNAIIEGTTSAYCIKTHAYFLRSNLEKVNKCTFYRSIKQLEEVVRSFDNQNSCSRTAYFFVSGIPMMWVQQTLMTELYLKIDSNESALKIFERLKLCEDQISTLIILGRYEDAENLTRQLLAVKETPKLYCILGDITEDIQYYGRAWELSNQTCSRAMRSLGHRYVKVGNLSDALECFLLSLKRSHFQPDLWFTVGRIYMSLEPPKLRDAIRCFKRSVQMNNNNAKAWSYLGRCNQSLENHEAAFKCFNEAIKCQYNNWIIWIAFIYAAVRIKHISQVILAYTQLMNLGQEFCDCNILDFLFNAVRYNITDYMGGLGGSYFDRVIKLLKPADSKEASRYAIWCYFYSEVESHLHEAQEIDYNITAFCALAICIREKVEDFKRCAKMANKLYLYIISEDRSSESSPKVRHLQSLKHIVQTLVRKGKKVSRTLDGVLDILKWRLDVMDVLNNILNQIEVEEAGHRLPG